MPWFIVFKKLPASAMALFPFVILKNTAQKTQNILINHEKIHLKQQLELLILPFYLIYLLYYLIGLLRYKNHYLAYFNIPFEKEAYQNDNNLVYLANRKWLAWINFI